MALSLDGIGRFMDRLEAAILASPHNRNACRSYVARALGQPVDETELEPEYEPEVDAKVIGAALDDVDLVHDIDGDVDEEEEDWVDTTPIRPVEPPPPLKAIPAWNPVLGCYVGITREDG